MNENPKLCVLKPFGEWPAIYRFPVWLITFLGKTAGNAQHEKGNEKQDDSSHRVSGLKNTTRAKVQIEGENSIKNDLKFCQD
jgi:hypothetical protein